MIEKKRRFGKVKTIKKLVKVSYGQCLMQDKVKRKHKIRFVCKKRRAETMRSHV